MNPQTIDEEDWRVYYQCFECGHWTLFQSSKELLGHCEYRSKCEACGSIRLDPQSAISQRTFNLERARKKETEVKKLAEKRKVRF